ncbi:DUF4128 domain-containing protein [Pseudomonas putida]|uniref:phage tail terminator-like protein n=1 Tax=Pseudomonas putida TaxID=303 RepID=UPI002363D66E|nr:phage tail terminator-like protein [Pseudomonas putida]MDD1966189.1 DUF4128 domain-containing protein [Pseudomonas putida]
MSHQIIRRIYEQRLASWAGPRGLRIAYQGVAFEPADDETYLRAFTLPAGTNTQTLEGTDRIYTGVFQISVVSPAGNGTGDAESLVYELDELFPTFLRLAQGDFEVMVLTPVEPGPAIEDSATLTVSASFQYRADRA